ncbi:unknown [Clostridium sp. CAG:58]|nr:unknown [Clostridium sp. CAG:58]
MEGQHDHQGHSCQRNDGYPVVIVGQDIPDIHGGGRHADHIGVLWIIFFHDLRQFFTALEGVAALLPVLHGDQDPGVRAGPELLCNSFRQKAFRDPLWKSPSHGQGVVDKFLVLQLLCQPALFYDVSVGHHGDDHIGLSKHVLDGPGVLIDPGAWTGAQGVVPVIKVVHGLSKVTGDRTEGRCCQHRDPDPVHQLSQAVQRRKEGSVGCFLDLLIEPQDQRGHQKQDRHQAAYDPLGKDEAHIPANGKFHQRNDQEAHDGGRAAGQDRAAGFLDGGLHGRT